MFNKQPSASKSFKHPAIIQIMIAVAISVISGYLMMAQAAIPRNEAVQLIQRSEDKQEDAIKRLEDKQDQILDKLNDLQIKVSVIGEHVGVKK